MLKKIAFIVLILFLMGSCSANTENENESDEVVKANELLPQDIENRELLIEEIGNEYINILDLEVYLFVEERFVYYEELDGEYIASKHDPLVTEEAQKEFNLSEEAINNKYLTIGSLVLGIEPKEVEKLDDSSTPVTIEVNSIEISKDNEIIVKVSSLTEIDSELPKLNMTFNLYKNDEQVGFQIVWVENLKQASCTYKSLPIKTDFESLEFTVYMNIDDMKNNNLRSPIQESNEKGSTVIPIYISNRIEIN